MALEKTPGLYFDLSNFAVVRYLVLLSSFSAPFSVGVVISLAYIPKCSQLSHFDAAMQH